MEEHKLIKDYTLANITLVKGGKVRAAKDKIEALRNAGFIAQPRKKKETAPEGAEE